MDAIQRYQRLQERYPDMPAVAILPLIFKLNGKPYSISEGHFPMEPLFRRTNLPLQLVLRCGRQVGKSQTFACSTILRAICNPYYKLLTVTPLFEQVRKFSSNYVKPALSECRFRSQILNRGQDNSVLQRTLSNGSYLLYNYASNSADRIRGTPSDEIFHDEVQDFDLSVLPVIESCLDASQFKLRRFAGTPKTTDGPLDQLWNKSSQAIWYIPCQTTGCKVENICSVSGHLLKMVDHPKTLVCYKCGQPLDSRLGYYVHTYPDRQMEFAGYSVPQPILPMHYADPKSWHRIQRAMKGDKPTFAFYNEILGEAYDIGSKMLSKEELAAAATLPVMLPKQWQGGRYLSVVLGVDWGGKGKERQTDREEFISNTVLCLAGLRHDGVVEVKWIYKTPYAANHNQEAEMVKDAAADARVNWVAHDFTGAGDVRETLLRNFGWPIERIIPFSLTVMGPNNPIVSYTPAGTTGVRSSYKLDKPRSLLLLCELIRRQKVLLPQYEGAREMLEDFFHIYHETVDSPRGKTSLVRRLTGTTDDVVMAINNAVMALYHTTESWPVLADSFQTLVPPIVTAMDWDDRDL
jgi:hypothetical protein